MGLHPVGKQTPLDPLSGNFCDRLSDSVGILEFEMVLEEAVGTEPGD